MSSSNEGHLPLGVVFICKIWFGHKSFSLKFGKDLTIGCWDISLLILVRAALCRRFRRNSRRPLLPSSAQSQAQLEAELALFPQWPRYVAAAPTHEILFHNQFAFYLCLTNNLSLLVCLASHYQLIYTPLPPHTHTHTHPTPSTFQLIFSQTSTSLKLQFSRHAICLARSCWFFRGNYTTLS